jgi:hypothetical protein
MPVLVPVSDQPIPNGHTNPPNVTATFVLNTGDSVTWGLASASFPQVPSGYGAYLYEDGTNALLVARHILPEETNVSFNYVATRPIGLYLTLQIGGAHFQYPDGTAHGYHAETSVLPAGNCQYGTQPKPQYAGVLNVTDQLIDLVLARYNASWLRRVIAQLLWGTVDTSSLCGSGPPALPPIDTSTLDASISTVLQIWRALLWAEVCECVPGTPAPTPYPPYVVDQPTGWPPSLVFTCTDTDLCASLLQLQRQMSVLLTQQANTLELTTLLQRYSLPFAYIPGKLHEGLSGSLAFGIERLVGIKVILKAAPDGLTAFTGVPIYITDLGWLSIVTADGMVEEVRYTRQEQVWLPTHMPAALSVGIALREGVIVDVLELLPEP